MARFLFGRRLSVALLLGIFAPALQARDLRIPLPARSETTPVQRLNQEGVDAVRKRQYGKANELFYKAYLYDPEDPFTLNNLGYMAELGGEADRALTFYDLASRQMTDAVIDRSSSTKLEGKSFRDEIAGINDPAMRVSRANVAAVRLLSKGRNTEAEALLEDALTIDPHNAFTLNNLGVAKEAEGDLESALKYYTDAAKTRSSKPVVVTFNRVWRGKAVSEVAADSARAVQKRLHTETIQERAARLNFRGVEAINRNDRETAVEDFRAAYSLDPGSAFSLNNLGYSAEVSGDAETAQFFYQKAREAQGARAKVGLATGQSAEGMPLFQVAGANDQKVATRMAEEVEARRRQPGPVVLKHRDNTPVIEPASQSAPAPEKVAPPAPDSNLPASLPNGAQPQNP
jgi:Flp pilus assembly protein TadD